MARKPRTKKVVKSESRPAALFDEKTLTKGQIRKLTALRKSLGDEIADEAFAKWLATQESGDSADKNAELIAEVLYSFVEKKQLKIPRDGYLITRGRGRLIVAGGGEVGNG